jgi:hypothetical protein
VDSTGARHWKVRPEDMQMAFVIGCGYPINVGVEGQPEKESDVIGLTAIINPSRVPVRLSVVTRRAGDVGLEVFGVGGRCLRRIDLGHRGAGTHLVEWDGEDAEGRRAASGMYWIRGRVDGVSGIRRLVLLR